MFLDYHKTQSTSGADHVSGCICIWLVAVNVCLLCKINFVLTKCSNMARSSLFGMTVPFLGQVVILPSVPDKKS